MQILDGVHALLGHILLGQHCGDFLCTVVTIIEEDNHVAFLYAAIHVGIHNRLYELIGDIVVIRFLHCSLHVGSLFTYAVYELVISNLYAIPTLVTVHGIITAYDRGYNARALLAMLLQVVDKAFSALRVGVTTIHETVQVHVLQSIFLGYVAQGKYVFK